MGVVHIMSRWMINLGMNLLKILGVHVVDNLMVMQSGVRRSKQVRDLKAQRGPVSYEGQVLPAAIRSIRGGNEVMLDNDNSYHFDAIVFAIGFRRFTNNWLICWNSDLSEPRSNGVEEAALRIIEFMSLVA
ncbi:LOW QUALITY PROTEIN: hypothetical protein V2J09_021332 [Rumex salicifolius]